MTARLLINKPVCVCCTSKYSYVKIQIIILSRSKQDHFSVSPFDQLPDPRFLINQTLEMTFLLK